MLKGLLKRCRLAAAVGTAVCLAMLLGAAGPLGAVPDFTFIQVSDIHAPRAESQETIAKIPGLLGQEVNLKAYNVTVPAPSFIITTGDLDEFGSGLDYWPQFMSYWDNCKVPIYHELGNHDNTWHAGMKHLRELGYGPWYSFNKSGCHFIGLMSPTCQDPRPSFGEEELLWLKQDLKNVSPGTPIFVYFHHPLVTDGEFASRYDWDRMLDILRPYNLTLLLTGHSHSAAPVPIAETNQIMGGSPFGGEPGFMFISVKDDVLRCAYWTVADSAANKKVLEQPISLRPAYPKITIASPKHQQTYGASLSVSATIAAQAVEAASYTIDEEQNGALSVAGTPGKFIASGQVDTSKLMSGAHYMRVIFKSGGKEYSHSLEFFVEKPVHCVAWRQYMASSSKVTPAIASGVVYAGAMDGRLHAYDAKTGKERWVVSTGAEILASPLVVNGKVIACNGMGNVSAYSTAAGKKLWSFKAADAVYSSPATASGLVVFGCNDGKVYALDAATGKLAWTTTEAQYSIESAVCISNGKVYYGAWDEYVYCVNLKDGQQVWKQQGEGSRVVSGAKRYYSPADCGPVVVGGKVFVADRNYKLAILNAETGERLGAMDDAAATGTSEDGKFVYLRRLSGDLTKLDASGKVVWTTPALLNAIAAAPTECKGIAYVCSSRGTVSAVSAADGKILWQFQASPQLWVMSSVVSDGKNAYVTAFDGNLTAIRVP